MSWSLVAASSAWPQPLHYLSVHRPERSPSLHIAIGDKESSVARHQSGNNSGVIHSGLYYRPGSLTAELCLVGTHRLVTFCDEHGIRYLRNGKVVIATNESQFPALDELNRRETANGLHGLRRLNQTELRAIEPHAAGLGGLHMPTTGAVDFAEVASVMARLLEARDVEISGPFPQR